MSVDLHPETLGLCLSYFDVRRHVEFALQLKETPSLLTSLVAGCLKRRLNRHQVCPASARDVISAFMRGLPRQDPPAVELNTHVECLLYSATTATLKRFNDAVNYMVSFSLSLMCHCHGWK